MKLYKQFLIESVMSDEAKVKTVMNVAGAVIMRIDENDTKQVLLIQRSADDHWPNHWEYPRGKCDKPIGESLIKCVKREAKEETNLDIKVLGLIDKFEYLADGGTRKSICYNFLCKMKDPNQKIKLLRNKESGVIEHQDYHWISEMGEAEMMLMPEQKKTLEKVLNSDRSIVSYPDNDFTKNNQIEEYLQWLYHKTI